MGYAQLLVSVVWWRHDRREPYRLDSYRAIQHACMHGAFKGVGLLLVYKIEYKMEDPLEEREVLLWLSERVSSADWRLLGTNLGLRGALLRQIRADYQDSQDRLWMVTHHWLLQSYNVDKYGLPTWAGLKNAVANTNK